MIQGRKGALNMEKYKGRFDEVKIIHLKEKVESIIFERQEYGLLHNPYNWGQDLYHAVCSGDTAQLREVLDNGIEIPGTPGKLAKNDLRALKNLMICYIANLTAELIRDGYLSDEQAYTISDAAILTIEDANDPEAVINSVGACLYVLNETIGAIRRRYHPLVRDTKNYIYKHLHEKIRIDDIAAKLNTSPSYLAQVFRRYENTTIREFIRKEKLERGKNLLLYSDLSLQGIANYLGFSSSSHFGREFKAETGMTPSEYRRQAKEKTRDEL